MPSHRLPLAILASIAGAISLASRTPPGLERWRVYKSLRNTIVFTLGSQAIVVVMANVLAQILLMDFRGKKIFRFLIMLPWTTPIALSVLGWFWIFDSVYSPIDYVLREVGLLGPGNRWGPQRNMYWLGETELAQGAVLMIHVWRTLPLATVILIGGLTSIPHDINEAADYGWRRILAQTLGSFGCHCSCRSWPWPCCSA